MMVMTEQDYGSKDFLAEHTLYCQKAYKLEKGVKLEGLLNEIVTRPYWEKVSKWMMKDMEKVSVKNYSGGGMLKSMLSVGRIPTKSWTKENDTVGFVDISSKKSKMYAAEIVVGRVYVNIADDVLLVRACNLLAPNPNILTDVSISASGMETEYRKMCENCSDQYNQYFYGDLFRDLDMYVERMHKAYQDNVCPVCGEAIAGKGRFCANCGAPLE
ncbi:MAG: hypothetical protein ACI3U2_03235 [Anaerovibrio sp.]